MPRTQARIRIAAAEPDIAVDEAAANAGKLRSDFANLRAGRDPMLGVDAPRSEIIFRENLP